MLRKVIFLWLCAVVPLSAQENFFENDVKDTRPTKYALTYAHIYVNAHTLLRYATLLIDEGKVVDVGTHIDVPSEAQVINLKGYTIYPSFIDPYVPNFGLEVAETKQPKHYYSATHAPILFPEKETLYGANDALKAAFRAKDHITTDPKRSKELRASGYGAILSFRQDGIARGTGILLSLAERPIHRRIILGEASSHFSFHKGSSQQEYPRSLLGAAALLRQSHFDAAWYAQSTSPEQHNLTLQALIKTQSLPQMIEVSNKDFAILASKIGQELGIRYIIQGAGDEYQRLEEIASMDLSLIIPLGYPKAYDVSDLYVAQDVSWKQLKHWELAPANAAMLHEAGVHFAFTSKGLKDPKKELLPAIRQALQWGLPKEVALQALTSHPAEILGISDRIGTLEKGKIANFLVCSGDLFEKDTDILEHWIQGQPHLLLERHPPNYKGKYHLSIADETFELHITGSLQKPLAKVYKIQNTEDTLLYSTTFQTQKSRVILHFSDTAHHSTFRLTGWPVGNDLRGKALLQEGVWRPWEAKYITLPDESSVPADTLDSLSIEDQMRYPFSSYGYTTLPGEETYLIQNATIWTNEAEGIIQAGDVLVRNGKIVAVGENLPMPADATLIEAEDKHLTSGIIDEHSHIAAYAVNEWGENMSSEVRMSDVIRADDINIYRQLAGGVTAVQLLHGSANPIGGQSALLKLRWGSAAKDMLIQDAPGFMKFALGENVKRANAPQLWSIRYPQSRMGVEQVLVDAFIRAKEYNKIWEKYTKDPKHVEKPRRDLRLEALVEILKGQRFITCHSYVQSEVNMLMKLAETFQFRVNTFTHILEGYKVADKMYRHGAAASTFSDWWAYKYEVREAIPYNAALMHKAGILVAINSDDPEMGRRLNQEAAKTILYGGLSEIEAWKTITLNPARMLHLDHRMGSIRVGKDADLVLWNRHPLSVYARAEKTFVDGRLLYNSAQQESLQKIIQKDRNRLIHKMLKAKASGNPVSELQTSTQETYRCHE